MLILINIINIGVGISKYLCKKYYKIFLPQFLVWLKEV